MLVLRSADVTEPGTWGLPGGKVEDGETPEHGALHELHEETQYDGPIVVFPSHVYKERGFEYHNFLGLVPEEFEATLDWENDDAQWFALDDLPSPLHFGVAPLISEASGEIPEVISQCERVFSRGT